jgi:hypothetical protein
MTITVIAVIVVIAVIAWLLYKAGFKPKEITVKAGPLEAKMERSPAAAGTATEKQDTPKARTEATQEALQGAHIDNSTITAPADSGAKLKQKAEGEGSSITGSTIQLDKEEHNG